MYKHQLADFKDQSKQLAKAIAEVSPALAFQGARRVNFAAVALGYKNHSDLIHRVPGGGGNEIFDLFGDDPRGFACDYSTASGVPIDTILEAIELCRKH